MTNKEIREAEKREIAYEKSTDEERQFISTGPAKNRSVWIILGTIAVLAIATYWFYKH